MPSIDNRVVEMQFNNAQFERGIKNSTESIGRLKESLNFDKQTASLKQFESYSNSVNFSALQNGIEALKNRFSTLGIAGMTVIQNLTNEAMYLGSRLVSSLAAPMANVQYLIKEGGKQRALNVEQAKFIMEGLKLDFNSFNEDINNAVNGTRFGYDEAAMAASQLAASGVDASKKLDKSGKEITNMGQALLAISGAAAMTNSEYTDMANIFTTVASNGRLMTEQVRSFSYRGLNITADMAKYFGTTEAAMADMISKGKIDFKKFSEAIYELYGNQATKADEMLTGVTANIRAAWKKIGQDFWTPVVANNGPIVKGLQKFKDLVNKTIRPAVRSIFQIDGKEFTEDNQWMRMINNLGAAMQKLFSSDRTIAAVKDSVYSFGKVAKRAVTAFNELITNNKSFIILNDLAVAFRYTRDSVVAFAKPFTNILSDLIPRVTLSDIEKFTKKIFNLSRTLQTFVGLRTLTRYAEDFADAIKEMADPSTKFDKFITFEKIWISLQNTVRNVGNGIKNIFESTLEFIKPFKDILLDFIPEHIFPLTISEEIEKLSKKFLDFSEVAKAMVGLETFGQYWEEHSTPTEGAPVNAGKFIEFWRIWQNLQHIFAKSLDILSDLWTIAYEAFSAFFKVFTKVDIGGEVKGITDAISTLVDTIAGIIHHIAEFVKNSEIFERTFIIIRDTVAPILETLYQLFLGFVKAITPLATWAGDTIIGFFKMFQLAFLDAPSQAMSPDSPMSGFINWVLGGLEKIQNAFLTIWKALQPTIELLKLRIAGAMSKIVSAFQVDAVATSLKTGGLLALVAILQQLYATYKWKLWNKFVNAFGKISEFGKLIKNVVGNISSALSANVKNVQIDRVKTLAEAILILAAAMFVISLIPVDQLLPAVGVITAAVAEIAGMLYFFEKLGEKAAKKGDIVGDFQFAARAAAFAVEMIALGAAVLLIASAIKKLADLDPEGLGRGIVTIGIIMLALGLFANFTKFDKDVKRPSGSLIAVALSVVILAMTLKSLAKLDNEGMVRGIMGVYALMGALWLFTKYTKTPKGLVKAVFSMILLGVALRILVSSVKGLAKIEPEALGRGLIGVYSLMAAMAIFGQYAKLTKDATKSAGAMILIGIAVRIFANSVAAMAKIDPEGYARGLIGIYGIIGAMMIFGRYMKTADGLMSASFAMILLGVAMNAFARAIVIMGTMDPEAMARGVIALGIALFEVSVALHYISKNAMSVGDIASILMMGVVVNALATAIVKIATLDPERMASGIIGLSVALAAVVVALKALSAGDITGASMMAKGAAFVLMGIGINFLANGLRKLAEIEPKKLGIGIVGLSVALFAMAAMSLVASKPLLILGAAVGAFGAGVGALAWGLAKLSVAMMTFVGLLKFGGPELKEAIETIFIWLAQAIPVFITEFIAALARGIDKIVEAVANLIITFFKKLIEVLPLIAPVIVEFAKVMWDIIWPLLGMLFTWIWEKLKIFWAWFTTDGLSAIGTFFVWVGEKIVQGFTFLFGWLGQGLAWIGETIGSFLANLLITIFTKAGEWLGAGKEFIVNLIAGIGEKVGEAIDAVAQLGKKMVEKVGEFFTDFYNAGKNIVEGIKQGINDFIEDPLGSIGGLCTSMWERFTRFWDEHSPSRRSKWGAEMIVRGITKGIDDYSHLAVNSVKGLNDTMWDQMQWVNGTIIDALNSDLNPTITPVLDLSEIQNGTNTINGMFGGVRSFTLAAANNAKLEANRLDQLNKLEMQSTNADVVAALGLLRGDVNNLNDSFANTQVVLDSGALVGATAKKMDSALGRIKVYKGRGI